MIENWQLRKLLDGLLPDELRDDGYETLKWWLGDGIHSELDVQDWATLWRIASGEDLEPC